jgi:hypothetical protein
VVVDGALRLLAPHHQRLAVLGILLGANQRECSRNIWVYVYHACFFSQRHIQKT